MKVDLLKIMHQLLVLKQLQDFLLADLGAGIAYNGKTGGTDIGTVPVYLVARWNLLQYF